MKTIAIWEKLKLQVENLEMMSKQHEQGIDMSTMAYWQVETIYEILKGVEKYFGADEVRKEMSGLYERLADDVKKAKECVSEKEVVANEEISSNVINVYTDGGCRGNGKENNVGAWAYTIDIDGAISEDYKAVENTTNNIQELSACTNALATLIGVEAAVIVYSDSAYVVNGMNDWIKGWKSNGWKKSKGEILNLDLWKELDHLANQFSSIKFIKVKGHSDNKGNQRADELVNKAMDDLNK